MYNVGQTKHGPDKERILRNELNILGGVQLVVPFLPWDFNEFDTHETILNSTSGL